MNRLMVVVLLVLARARAVTVRLTIILCKKVGSKLHRCTRGITLAVVRARLFIKSVLSGIASALEGSNLLGLEGRGKDIVVEESIAVTHV